MTKRNPESLFIGRSLRIKVGGRLLPVETAVFPEDFPDRLRRLKEASGLTWTGFAWAIGVDLKQLRRWLTKGRGALRRSPDGPVPLRGPHSRRRRNPPGRGLPADLLRHGRGRGGLDPTTRPRRPSPPPAPAAYSAYNLLYDGSTGETPPSEIYARQEQEGTETKKEARRGRPGDRRGPGILQPRTRRPGAAAPPVVLDGQACHQGSTGRSG